MPLEFTAEEAKIFLERITPNKDYLYILQPLGLADVIFTGGLSYAVQKKLGKSATVLIVQEGIKILVSNMKMSSNFPTLLLKF